MVAGGVDQPDDVVRDRRVHVDLADGCLQLAQLLDAEDFLDGVQRVGPLLLVEDDDLLDRLRIAQAQADHEAVELGLGQGEGALVLDRVLGGDDQERVRHRVGDAVDGRLPLLHALEERATGSWASPD